MEIIMTQQNYESVTRCQAITDIFEAIAKQEEALAKILKEAGEKPHFEKECTHYDSAASDEDKDKDKDKDTIALLSAVTRLEFLIVAKAYLFADCACPKNGCPDEKPHK